MMGRGGTIGGITAILPQIAVEWVTKDLPFSLKKSWGLVCLRTARSLLQTLSGLHPDLNRIVRNLV